MLVTKKQKRVIGISLIVALIVAVLVAMSVGIYFIVVAGRGQLLTKEQQKFGDAFSSLTSSPKEQVIDSAALPEGVKVEDITLITENYIVSKSSNGEYKVYSRLQKKFVSIQNNFISVEKVVGNLAVIKTETSSEVVDLLTGLTFCNLNNAKISYAGSYALIETDDEGQVEFLKGESKEGLCAYVVDTETNEYVYGVSSNENAIRLELSSNFAFAYFKDKTVVVSLKDTSLTKAYQNVLVDGGNGLKSEYNGAKFTINDFTRASELSPNAVLIERAVADEQNYDIKAETGMFKLEYSLLDLENNIQHPIESEGCVLSGEDALAEGYVAIVFSKIENKTAISAYEQTIKYYQYDPSNPTLKEIVKLDYVKNGKVVGFNGQTLIVNGGTTSGGVDFNGQNTDKLKADNDEKISFTSDVYVMTSIIGEKTIYTLEGEKLFDKTFTRVSPFYNGYALAYDGVSYYVINVKGEQSKVKLNAGAVDYAFMGLGLYFVDGEQGIDVVRLGGERIYKDVAIDFSLTSSSTVMLKISKNSSSTVMVIEAQKGYVKTENDSYVAEQGAASQKSFASRVKNLIENDNLLGAVGDMTLDAESGAGKTAYGFDLDTSKIDFKSYDSLTEAERALVPTFDAGQTYVNSRNAGVVYTFEGAYVLTNQNIAMMIIKIAQGDQIFYAISIATKDMYISKITGYSTNSGGPENLRGVHDQLPYDFTDGSLTSGAIGNVGYGMIFFDEYLENKRVPDYKSAGYDTCIVLTSRPANFLSINVEVRNTFFANNISSMYFNLENAPGSGQRTEEFDNYSVTINFAARTATITAREGALLNGFSIAYAKPVTSAYNTYEDTKTVDYGDVLATSCVVSLDSDESAFRIKSLNLTELYHILNLVNYDGNTLSKVYYFYGFKEGNNPAPFGFENFYRKTKVNVPSRTGYDFDNFSYEGWSNPAINNEGLWVGTEKFVKTKEGVETFNLDAKYIAKQYKVYYEVFGEQAAVSLDATFGSPLGSSLLDKDGILEAFRGSLLEDQIRGSNFNGWFDARNGEGKKYDSETVYEIDGPLTLYAHMTPKVFEITLHSNIETYREKNIEGFTYDIGRVTLKEGYLSLAAGAEFTTTTKNVTYGTNYGQLPSLVGEGTTRAQRYVFVGWFDQAQYNYLGNGSYNRGNEVRSETLVTSSPALDLYAHYIREVYMVRLNLNINGEAMPGNMAQTYLEALHYAGSDNYGKSVTKDITSTDDGLWEVQGTGFRAYSLQGEDLTIGILAAAAYYLSSIKVSVYVGASDPYVYQTSYTYNSNNDTTSTTSVTDNTYVKITNEGEIGITLKSMNNTASLTDYAVIDIDISDKTYSNEFAFSDFTNVDVTTAGEGIKKDSTVDSFVFSNVVYETQNSFNVLLNKNADFADSYIKQVKLNGKTLDFTIGYEKKYDNKYHLLLTCSEAGTEDYKENTLTTTYSLVSGDNVVNLVVINDLETGKITYRFDIKQKENYRIEIAVEKMSSTITMAAHNGVETKPVVGVSIEKNGAALSSNAYINSITPADVLVYRVKVGDGVFINKLTMTIRGETYELFKTSFRDNEGSFEYYVTYDATNDWFVLSEPNKISISGTNVYVRYDAAAQDFVFYFNNIAQDISFDVYYLSMTEIELHGLGKEVNYDVRVTTGTTLGSIMSETEEVTAGTTFEGNKIYRIGNIFVFLGYSDSIKNIEIELSAGTNIAYRIVRTEASPSSGYCSVDSSLKKASINMAATSVKIYFEGVAGTITNVTSYLGRGGSSFSPDPMSGFGLLSDIKITYLNAQYEEVTVSFSENMEQFTFYNGTIVVKVYQIKGYKYQSAQVRASRTLTFDPVVSTGSDEDGDYTELKFTIDDYTLLTFELEIYQVAFEYEVKYDPSNDETHTASGSMPNTHHVYNVESKLAEGGYTRNHYTLVGYSRIPLTGVAPERYMDYLDFVPGATLTEPLTDKDNDVVTLYCIFIADTIEVEYVLNDISNGNGSTTATRSGGKDSVVYDQAFGNLPAATRDGYTFDGWYTSLSSSATKIQNSTILNDELVREMTIRNGKLQIYAKWNAIKYTIVIHKNDASESGGFGSSAATGSSVEYEAYFDARFSQFNTLYRVGYDFLGYKAVRLNSSTAKTDTHRYIGYGPNAVTIIDSTASSIGINPNATTINLYAVYTAVTFRAYVYLNNQTLQTYEQEDGKFTVSYKGRTIQSNVAYLDLYMEVEFDAEFGEMPTVEPIGYDFVGFYAESGNPLNIPSSGVFSSRVKFDYALFSASSFTSNLGETTALPTLYASGTKTFSLYAHYHSASFGITYSGFEDPNANKFHFEEASAIGSYDHTKTKVSDTDNIMDGVYGGSYVLDIMTVTGKYLKNIYIRYFDQNYVEQTITISFRWENTEKLYMSVSGSNVSISNNSTTGEFIRIFNSKLYVANGIFIKVVDYNRDGKDADNVVVDASRIILGFEQIKTEMFVSVESVAQTFNVKYYRYVSGNDEYGISTPSEYIGEKSIDYGTVVTNDFLNDHAYTKYFGFVNYYYCILEDGHITNPLENPESKLLQLGEKITKNTTLVGYYEVVLKQSVNFYYYDTLTGQYVLRAETSRNYVLNYYDEDAGRFIDGTNTEYYSLSGANAGTVLKIPSLSHEAWPSGTCLVGYVVADSAPGSGYYSFANGNTTGLAIFDIGYIVDKEVNVYAVYNTESFVLDMQYSSGRLQARASYRLYDSSPDGSITEVSPSDIYLIRLNEDEMNTLRTFINTDKEQSIAVALGNVLLRNLDRRVAFRSRNYEDITSNAGIGYYFLITVLTNSSGEPYIYRVSSNYYRANGNTSLSSYQVSSLY